MNMYMYYLIHNHLQRQTIGDTNDYTRQSFFSQRVVPVCQGVDTIR